MDDRLVAFTRGLRGAGVRVSSAEAMDAGRAALVPGVADREAFRLALRATLVKDPAHREAFDALFPVYFGGAPAMSDAMAHLGPDEQAEVRAAIAALGRRLRELLEMLATGSSPSAEELSERARRAAELSPTGSQGAVTRRMLRSLGLGQLAALLQALREALEEAGIEASAADQLISGMRANAAALTEAASQQAAAAVAEHGEGAPGAELPSALADVPLHALSSVETAQLRREVARLVARLRSRAALRRRRAAGGSPDPRRTLRLSQRYGGVPMELAFRRRRRKPRLVMVCDVSTSMRPVAGLMLGMVYELHDQVSRARSFVFNDDLVEVTSLLAARRPGDAVEQVLRDVPPGYYATDLGRSLETLAREHGAAVDRRTTLIVLGDGRNNLRPHRAEVLRDLRRRARRVLWLNPEPMGRWDTGDSDMGAYAESCDEVLKVETLRELAAAIDRLLAG